MIVGLIGARGTVPTDAMATVSFLVDHKYLFECPSEIIPAFDRFQKEWARISVHKSPPQLAALGRPTLGKVRYVIISHLHYDHWGGLPHIIHRILLLEREARERRPLSIIIPKGSTIPFQLRMQALFSLQESNLPLSDVEFLYYWLTIEVGAAIRKVVRIISIEDGDVVPLDPGYFLSCKKNPHLEIGSVAYKLIFRKPKLDVNRAKSLEIPFNRTLKRIEKSQSPVKVGDIFVSRNDIYFDLTKTLCYSGDTNVDSGLFEFFRDAQILIHEATYLTKQKNFHLESHSDLDSLIPEIEKLKDPATLLGFIPIHFSTRYKEEEISMHLSQLSKDRMNLCQVINPIVTLYVLITDYGHLDFIERPQKSLANHSETDR
ncbi:MAG: MBL fold metallo-hydrolase [Candidatus Heimdallarchaeota archaeon]